MGSQTYLVEQWESLEGIKFNHRAKINTKVFCLSGVLREGSFYFGQGTLGSLKQMGPFGPYFWWDPKDPYRRKDPPLRTHGGLKYYLKARKILKACLMLVVVFLVCFSKIDFFSKKLC